MNADALAKQWHQCIRPDVNGFLQNIVGLFCVVSIISLDTIHLRNDVRSFLDQAFIQIQP